MKIVEVDKIKIGGANPLALIAGPCVIESEDLVLKIADQIKVVADRLGFPFIFKSSYLKDNRSSVETYQGPGVDEGLKILDKVKQKIGVFRKPKVIRSKLE